MVRIANAGPGSIHFEVYESISCSVRARIVYFNLYVCTMLGVLVGLCAAFYKLEFPLSAAVRLVCTYCKSIAAAHC
jgi:hypothetical protein